MNLTYNSQTMNAHSLVSTLERRNRLALVLVQGCVRDVAVVKVDPAVGVPLPCKGVLCPVLVVTLREVLACVGTTGFLTVSGGNSGLGTSLVSLYTTGRLRGYIRASEEVTKLKSLNEVGVPDHATVLGTNLVEHLVDTDNLLDTLVE